MSESLRAPAGGCEVGGLRYEGGQFLPDGGPSPETTRFRPVWEPRGHECGDWWGECDAPGYSRIGWDYSEYDGAPVRAGRLADGTGIGKYILSISCTALPLDRPYWQIDKSHLVGCNLPPAGRRAAVVELCGSAS